MSRARRMEIDNARICADYRARIKDIGCAETFESGLPMVSEPMHPYGDLPF